MSYLSSNCDCSTDFVEGVVGCTSNCSNGSAGAINTQKIILNQVRAPASLYTMNLGVFNVKGNYNTLNWNQSSDRRVAGIVTKNVPSRGDSTRSTKTSLKPGGASAPGTGVDVKHNSYARYLARRKSSVLRTTAEVTPALKGNKTRAYGMLGNAACNC
jgi:hypothetical protein